MTKDSGKEATVEKKRNLQQNQAVCGQLPQPAVVRGWQHKRRKNNVLLLPTNL